MSTESFTLSVRENSEDGELIAELRTEEGLIAATERITYEDFSMAASESGRDDPDPRETEVTTDATTLDIRIDRGPAAFEVRVLGDTGVLARERVEDGDWGLVGA